MLQPPRSSLSAFSSLLSAFCFLIPLSLFALDGLTFNGGQRIETGYCPTASDRFECEVTVNAVQPNASAAVFGTVREQEPERTFAFYVRQGGDDSSVVAYGGAARGGFFPRGKKVSLTVGPDGATWTWDGGFERLSLTPGFACDGVTPLLIGDANTARNVGDSVPAGTGAAMTLHRFRIWRGGLELVHDYEPGEKDSRIGLRDVKDGSFLAIQPQSESQTVKVTVANDIPHVSNVVVHGPSGRLTGRDVGNDTVYQVRKGDDIVVYYTLAPGYVSKTPNPISYPKISGNVWIDNVKINAQTKYVKVTVENAIPHVTNVVVSSQTGRAISSTVDGSNTVYEVERWDNISVRYEVESNYVSLVRNPIPYPEISADVTINGTWLKAVLPLKENIPYRARDAKKAAMVDCVCTNAIPVTADVRDLTDGRWYAVTGTISRGTITVCGSAHLILCDGAKLSVTGSEDDAGVAVEAGNALTIYGQSAGTGELVAKTTEQGGHRGAGIGGASGRAGGAVTIDGGRVTATGGWDGAGIGGGCYAASGAVTINGGIIRATGGGAGPGIGSGYRAKGAGGTLVVNGGTAMAKWAPNAVGPGGMYHGDDIGRGFEALDETSVKVTINGGSVKAGVIVRAPKSAKDAQLYCVTVKLSEEGRAGSVERGGKSGERGGKRLNVEGLGGYGTNDIYAVEGKVYLWLPKGTHRFAISDGETTNRYCAVVQGRGVTVEPLGPVGFYVNGVDIGKTGAGVGWFYQEKTLTLTNAVKYVLSGEAANDEVQVKVAQTGATVVLSNAVVFASGRPAFVAEKSASLQMAGGISYLAATNNAAAVTVSQPNATLAIGLASGANEAESMIGVFNYGEAKAIAGTGAVAVESGTFFVWADKQAVETPGKLTCGKDEVMMTGETSEKLKYATVCGNEPCVLVGPAVTVAVEDIPHVTGFTVSNAVETITNATGAATSRVMLGDDVYVGYSVEEGCFTLSANPLVYAAVESNVVVDASVIEILPHLPYRAWNEATGRMVDCECSNYTVVADSTATFEDGQWYAVTGTVECGSIAVSGAAHLILCDGAKLTAGAITNGALAVYGQPSGCGALEVPGTVAAALTVQGGRTSAGALSGDSLAVVGGTVTADDVRGGKATIDGGSVKAGQTTFVSDNFGQTDFVNRAGQPLHCVNVKVEKLKVEKLKGEGLKVERLTVEGLGNYGTNDIYPIDGRVYLWLPDGTHRFAVSDGARTNRYFAVVHGRSVTVEPLGPVGFFVNGVDIGSTGAGTGWVYMGKNLTLNGAGPYVLSGEAANDEVHIHVISPNAATVILSNAVVFVSGLLPALNVDQNASFLMAGGASYLAATNDAAAVTVGPSAALTVGLAPGADEAESMICVFNYGDRAAVDGAGAVAVNGGTLAVCADKRASAVPLSRAADVFCMVAGSNPETAKVVDKYNGEAYVLVTASVALVTPGRPVGPFATAEAATNVQAIAFVEPSAPVSEVLTSGALRKTYCDMFALGVTGGDAAWFVEAVLTLAARTNLAETATGATRQIPVAAIARLKPDVTTNVTVNGCAPGFYYSLRGSGSLEGLGSLEGSGGVESFAVYGPKLCGADAKVVFPEVKKPSEKAGFFKVGVSVTDGVGK